MSSKIACRFSASGSWTQRAMELDLNHRDDSMRRIIAIVLPEMPAAVASIISDFADFGPLLAHTMFESGPFVVMTAINCIPVSLSCTHTARRCQEVHECCIQAEEQMILNLEIDTISAQDQWK